MASRLEGGIHEAEDGLLGARVHQHTVRLDAVVQPGDLGAQDGVAGRFGIAEPELAERRLGARFERQQRLDRQRLAVRGAQQVGCAELVRGEEAFEREGRDFHEHLVARAETELASQIEHPRGDVEWGARARIETRAPHFGAGRAFDGPCHEAVS